MTPTRGQRLKEARGKRGLTLEEVARQTNIPLGHLRALEGDDLEALPEPVYVGAYLRALEDLLGISLTSVAAQEVPEVGQTLRRTRALASFSMLLLVLAASAVAFQSLPDRPEAAADGAEEGGVVVHVYARDKGNLRAWVDGQLVIDESYAKPTSDNAQPREGEGEEPPSRDIELRGARNVTVEATPVGAFQYRRNGEALKPVGRQTDTRTLVFKAERKETL